MKQTGLRKIFSLVLAFVMILSTCFVWLPEEAKAAETPSIIVSADRTDLYRGDTVNVSVSMEGNETGAGLQLAFFYDSNVLELQGDAVEGDVFAGASVADLYAGNEGVIRAALVAESDNTLSNGTVFSAAFQVKEDAPFGTVALSVGEILLADNDYQVIPMTVVNHAESMNVGAAVTGISLNQDSLTLVFGETAQLEAAVAPAEAEAEVTWSSSDPAVASVANGLVTAVGPGTAVITAEAGGYTAACEVTVTVPMTGISIKESTTIHRGDSEQLAVIYYPENTTDGRNTVWTSSDASVASVDGNGLVTAVNPGTAVVTAAVGAYSAQCLVTVDAPLETIVPDEPEINLIKNQTGVITYTLNPSDTTDSREVTFESSAPETVTVDAEGRITALEAGTAIITLTGANGVQAEVAVTVTEIPIDEVVISAVSAVVEKGNSLELTASVEPQNNTDADQEIRWSSSDESIATVAADPADSGKAVVTATEKGGRVTITASAWNGTSASCEIIVPIHMEGISLTDTVELLRGRTTVLDVTYLPADTDDDRTITWSSSDSSIASVDAETGMITALKAGTAVITAQTSTLNQATGEPFTASAEVTVVENSLTEESAGQIHLNIPEEGIYKGQKTDLNQLLNLDEIVEENQITDDITVEWESRNEDVASVDQNGLLTAVGEGTAEIVAAVTATDGNGQTQVYEMTFHVEIKEIPLESIAFDKVITEMQVGAVETLGILYHPENTTDDKTVVWSSSDPDVLSVENGVLTAKAEGTAVITAAAGDKSVSCTITVKAPAEAPSEETPADPSATDKSGGQGSAAETSGGAADTGDETFIYPYVILILAAGAAIAGVLLRRGRVRRR